MMWTLEEELLREIEGLAPKLDQLERVDRNEARRRRSLMIQLPVTETQARELLRVVRGAVT